MCDISVSNELQNLFVGALIGVLLASPGLAQSTFGSITGTVNDSTGAIVPRADVEVINEGTGVARRTTTAVAGVFNVPNLNPGTYKVHISAKGFTTYERANLNLIANQIINLDVPLALGETTTLMEVHEASPVITTEANDISGGMGQQSMESLPGVGRHAGDIGVFAYTTLTTGAAAVPSRSIPILGGLRDSVGVLPTIDGIAVMAYPQGAGPVQPSMESIQEVRMETAVAPAEFSTAGNVQIISRSGTNGYHGGAFWDYNGNALNARNFFSANVPFRVYNNFGASLGGPIKNNKLFFFVDYEGSREAATVTSVESVPLPEWRTGNFSGLSTIIKDPVTGQSFAGNIIPPDRISPVSKAIQSYTYPAPNSGAPGAIANNWTGNFPGLTGVTDFNNIDGRVDYTASSRDSVFGRLSWRRLPLTVLAIYPVYRDQERYGDSAVFSWNHIFSPAVVNEFRFGGTYSRNHYQANVIGSSLLAQFGIAGVPTTGVATEPYFNITGVTPWNPGPGDALFQDNPETTLEWIDNLSWTHGRHLLKFGFDALRDRFNGNNIAPPVYGEYDFTGVYTGAGYADFLLGIPQTTSLSLPNPNRHLRGTTYGLYAQDQFKVNSRLTLNYGLRWELEGPYSDTDGALYTFDPAINGLVVPNNGLNLVNAFYPKNIPITTASQAGYPNNLVAFNKKSFEPRVGFAYKPFGENIVVRGGYGIYSNLIYATLARSQETGGPFSGNVTYTNAIANGVPLFSFPSPFLPSGAASVQNVDAVNPHLKTPYTQQWNLTVERQVASFGLRASYVGSRTDQLVYLRNLNLPLPSTTSFTTSRRPDQLLNQIIYADSGGNDVYNALELAAQKRYGKNLTFSSGFTWAKDLTDTQDAGGGGTTFGGQVIQDPNCRACEWSNNEVMVPRQFFAFADYALPIGAGQPLLTGAHGLVQQILGGWRTTWTAVIQSGQYFTPSFSGFDPSGTGTFGGVPDRIGNGNLSSGQRSVSRWFDTAAFAIPGCPPATPVCSNPVPLGRWGNSGFNILAGPPARNLDFGLLKDFRYRDRYQLRFTMTMADAFNHPIFQVPNANISSQGTVGIISGTTRALLGGPQSREIDFALRLAF